MGCTNGHGKNAHHDPPADTHHAKVKLHGCCATGRQLEAKIVLIGNSGVGKTSIAQLYNHGGVNENTKATIGASYF